MGKVHICQCMSPILRLPQDFPVTIMGNRRKSGMQFVESVLSIAGGLSELGLEPGDVIAIAALNSDLYLEWLLAITFVGGIAAPLNYRWSFEEASFAIELVKPVMLVVDESCNFWSLMLLNKLPSLRFHVFLGVSSIISNDGYVITADSIKRPSKGLSAFDFRWAAECIALICFTSGTTGRPKGVALGHTALIVQSLEKIAIVGYGDSDVYLHTAPLCHIGGLSSGLALLMARGCHIFIPKFEAGSALQAIKQHSVTSFITVPAMMADLVSFFRKEKLSGGAESVKKILNGGGALSSELIRGASVIFPSAKLLSAYGMTETCSSLTFVMLHLAEAENSSKLQKNCGQISNTTHWPGGVCVGKPAPHVKLRIASTKIGMGSFAVGMILTRGPHLMEKYWDQDRAMPSDSGNQHQAVPSDTCSQGQAMVSDLGRHGWFDTGDIGWVDGNGDLWLLGRTKDRIKSGGENVYPEEVEAVILQHPGVSGVVVIGIPDARLGEKVAACIQMRKNWRWADGNTHRQSPEKSEEQLSGKMLQSFCKQRCLSGSQFITVSVLCQGQDESSSCAEIYRLIYSKKIQDLRFKIPRIFVLWEKPFPATSTGKLRRDELKREAMSNLQVLTSNL